MKMSLLSAAVGAAMLGSAGSAVALDVTHYAGAVKLYYSGATATDNALVDLFRAVGGICDPTPGIDVYRATNQYVVLCQVTSAQVPGFGTHDVAFHKESNGGSDRGVNPLIELGKFGTNTATGLTWFDISTLNIAGCTNTTKPAVLVSGVTVLHSYSDHASCPLTQTNPATIVATGGIADVDPPLVRPAVSDTDVNTYLTQSPSVQIVFGVPVTKSLYKALQEAEGITANAPCNVTPDDPTCVPSLTRQQLVSLFSQVNFDWSAFKDRSGNPLPTSVAAGLQPNDTIVRICRRVETSGTEAAAESYWLNNRCATGTAPFVSPDTGTSFVNDTTNHPFTNAQLDAQATTQASVSSGNLRTCLDIVEHNNATTDGTYRTGKPLWGIGTLSTEVTGTNMSDAHDSIRFVAIDGAAPTLANVINGDYNFYTDGILTKVSSGHTGFINPASSVGLIQGAIESKILTPSIIANIDNDYAGRPWGQGGILVPPGHGTPAAAPVSPAQAAGNVNNKSNHAATGSIKNCGPAIPVDGSSTSQLATPVDTKQQNN